jgi:hypothetical protein
MTATNGADAITQRKLSPRSGTDVRQRAAQVGVRLLPEEMAQLKAAADRDGVSPAEILRRAFLTR